MTTEDDEKPAKIPLRLQADAAQRELAMRHRVYPGLIAKGKMTAAEAASEIHTMRAIRDTLRLFAEHEHAVRNCVAEEIAKAHLFAAFPGAQLVDVREATTAEAPSGDTTAPSETEPEADAA